MFVNGTKPTWVTLATPEKSSSFQRKKEKDKVESKGRKADIK